MLSNLVISVNLSICKTITLFTHKLPKDSTVEPSVRDTLRGHTSIHKVLLYMCSAQNNLQKRKTPLDRVAVTIVSVSKVPLDIWPTITSGGSRVYKRGGGGGGGA